MSGGEALWVVCVTFIAVAFGMMSLFGAIEHNQDCGRRCEKRGEVMRRSGGVCTCRDGTSWVWEEGYDYKLGSR